jgi:hypothetical protein
MLQVVAAIIHCEMSEDMSAGREINCQTDLSFFSEEKYIRENLHDTERLALLLRTPTIDNIFEFIKTLFDCAQFSPECCVISLIYINRLTALTEQPLLSTNWRSIVLCSLLVAQKVWDDRSLSNANFTCSYPFFTTEEIEALEQKFMEVLNYSVTIKPTLYHKYYFNLRTLLNANISEFPIQQLGRTKAEEIEGRSAQVAKKERERALSRVNCA